MKQSSTSNRSSAIFKAIADGDLPQLERLASSGVNLNTRGTDGDTPLMYSIILRCSNITKFLLRRGVDVNTSNKIGQTALMLAAQAGDVLLIGELLKQQADPKKLDAEGRNAVAWAISQGDHADIVSRLAIAGADVDATDVRGITPLMRAAMLGFDESVATLLTLGADDKKTLNGKTAYTMAMEKGLADICRTIDRVLSARPQL